MASTDHERERLITDNESNDSLTYANSPTEETPLISNDLPDDIFPPKAFRRRVLTMCILSLFIVEVSQSIIGPPLQKITEGVICRGYYPDHLLRMPGRVEDHRCKNIDVQKTLAMVQGWDLAFGMAIPIVSQFPFGIIADKYGRRPVLFLSLIGCTLQTAWVMGVLLFPNVFSIWAVLVGNVLFLIGGGAPMAVAMVWTVVADVTTVASRTVTFNRLAAAAMIFQVLVNPVSAWLLQFDPWVSMWIGFAFLVIGTLSVLLIPETLRLRQEADDMHRAEHPNAEGYTPGASAQDGHEFPFGKQSVMKQAWFTVKNDMKHVWRFIFASKSIMILILACSTSYPIRLAFASISLQYMTKRFEWTWSTATYVSTAGSLATVVFLLVVLPIASALLNKRYSSRPLIRDLLLSRASMIFGTAGTFLVAVAGTPALFVIALIIASFGNSFNALVRALLSAMVEPHTIATLNTTISLLDMVMGLITGPAMGWLLSKGMELGGVWQGLPFMAATGLACIVTGLLFAVKIPAGVGQADEE